MVIAAFTLAVMERSGEKLRIAICLLIGFFALAILQWIISLQTKCPLCVPPVLASKSCSKNKKAQKLFGSYRLRVAASILSRNHYRCPYCSEPTELVVRDRKSRR